MSKPYGRVIRDLRTERGWSLDQLRKAAKVSYETLWRAEQSGNVGVLLIWRIAHALDVDISVFFGKQPSKHADRPPSVWTRLKGEQRAEVLRYAYRLLGERVPPEETG